MGASLTRENACADLRRRAEAGRGGRKAERRQKTPKICDACKRRRAGKSSTSARASQRASSQSLTSSTTCMPTPSAATPSCRPRSSAPEPKRHGALRRLSTSCKRCERATRMTCGPGSQRSCTMTPRSTPSACSCCGMSRRQSESSGGCSEGFACARGPVPRRVRNSCTRPCVRGGISLRDDSAGGENCMCDGQHGA